ncbi:Aspartokinase 1 chloroplastic, partial [Zea mays]
MRRRQLFVPMFWLVEYDTFDIGFITTDEFGNADILEATYPAVAKRLHGDWIQDPAIPVVTGFLGKGWKSGAVTTLGRGGSDLTATTIGKALGLREIQVWKDVDGVLTCDPNIYPHAKTVPYLTFEEATELAYFGAQIVLTSIVLKSNVTMLDIVSTRMLGQYGFLARVFAIFEDLCISVDCVATSEVSVSVSLDPSKIWSRELIQQASVSIPSFIYINNLINLQTGHVLRKSGVNVQMISQGASK